MRAVFISYSRKDFYFAESLAFHLDREGIRTWLRTILHRALGGNACRTAPGVIFVLALPFLLRWQTSRIAFWFPAPPAPGTKSVLRLNTPRKWDALIWTLLYMGLWMLRLGV